MHLQVLFAILHVFINCRFWDDTYYPLDTLGYGDEGQQDCNAKLHNFG